MVEMGLLLTGLQAVVPEQPPSICRPLPQLTQTDFQWDLRRCLSPKTATLLC